jgi:hypothetical protein
MDLYLEMLSCYETEFEVSIFKEINMKQVSFIFQSHTYGLKLTATGKLNHSTHFVL